MRNFKLLEESTYNLLANDVTEIKRMLSKFIEKLTADR
jgi:hypothetical protein